MVTEPKYSFKRIGGRVSLDFLNTVDGARGGQWVERLATFADLTEFAQILTQRQ